MSRAGRAAESPHAVGPVLLRMGVQQWQLFLSFPEPRELLLRDGVHLASPPSFQPATYKLGCQCPVWSSASSCVESYVQIHEENVSKIYSP